MTVTNSSAASYGDVGAKAKHWLNLAIFPVSAGAVGAEVVTVATMVVSVEHAKTAGVWAGIVCAAAALAFQIGTRKRP